MRIMKPLATTIALAIGASALVSTASADDPYRHRHHHRHNDGANVAAGIAGFAAGAIVGGALAQPRYQPYYEAPPQRVYYQHPEPWTRAWYAWCSDVHPGFNPNTGYFPAGDGTYHFCH
jgi:hypothetical protein